MHLSHQNSMKKLNFTNSRHHDFITTWEDDWTSDSRNSPGDSFVNNPMSCHYMIYTTHVLILSFSLAHCIWISIWICICIIVYVYYGVKFGSWLLWLPILILASDASALEHWKTFAKCGFHMKYIWKYIIYKWNMKCWSYMIAPYPMSW